MCWGTPAVVIDIDRDTMIAKVDFGDGVVREVLIGISDEKIAKGDIVIVHAGVVISKLNRKGVIEHIKFLNEVLGEDAKELIDTYQEILSLAYSLGGEKESE